MDTSKLLNVLKDISAEDKQSKIGTKLNELHSSISQNNIEQSDQKKNEIYTILEDSIINDYTESNIKVIKKIDGDIYLGKTAKEHIEAIFSSDNYKSLSNLATYNKNRAAFIQKVDSLINSLENFNFRPHYYNQDYEIGLTLPDEFNTLENIYQSLEDWDKFLNVICEISGEKRGNDISLLNNGTWQFFIIKGIVIIEILDIVLSKIANLYEQINRIQKGFEELKFLKSKNLEAEQKNAEKEIYNNFLKEVLEEALKKYKGDNGRKNELKNELRVNVKKILKLTEHGANIEIITPELEEPDEPKTEEEKNNNEFIKNKKEYEKELEDIKKIQNSNKKIAKIKVNSTKRLLNSGLLEENDNSKKE